MNIGIPTLYRYDTLCSNLMQLTDEHIKLFILDNGGGLQTCTYWKQVLDHLEGCEIEHTVFTPRWNMGVAWSWNKIMMELGPCLIVNDDVRFQRSTYAKFEEWASHDPNTVIFQNDSKWNGFSIFYVSQPEVWLEQGGFDVNFYPCYGEDDDCRYRLKLLGHPVKAVRLPDWEHQATGMQDHPLMKRFERGFVKRNRRYYLAKWGGPAGSERFKVPFGDANNAQPPN